MRVGVPKESREGERRVALIPEAAGSLIDKGLEVVVEAGAGDASGHPDSEYSEARAKVGSAEDAWSADVVIKVTVDRLIRRYADPIFGWGIETSAGTKTDESPAQRFRITVPPPRAS